MCIAHACNKIRVGSARLFGSEILMRYNFVSDFKQYKSGIIDVWYDGWHLVKIFSVVAWETRTDFFFY